MLLPVLASGSPVTIEQLQVALGSVSARTAFRYLSQIPHLRSYNHNGRFYTALDPARFDRFGLFSIGDARFSRDRSLTATVRRLVRESEEGFTDKQLRGLLHVRVHAFLREAVRQGRARRELLGGVFVYFDADPEAGAAQRRARLARLDAQRAADLQESVIIEILLVLVRCPGLTAQQAARRLRGHSPPIPLAQVQAVFDRFELAAAGQ